MEYLSKQRYDEILAELNHLIDVVYPEIRDALAETSAQDDRGIGCTWPSALLTPAYS